MRFVRIVSLALVFIVATMAGASDKNKKTYYDLAEAPMHFDQFVNEHNRKYKDEADKEVHYQAFRNNLEKINKLNANNPDATYGINKFADYTEEERKNMFGLRHN